MARFAATSARNAASERAVPSNRLWLGLALLLVAFVAYFPALSAGYVWDDDWYLTANPLLGDARGLMRIWIPGSTPQYYPAVFTAFWIEHRIWGLAPAGYHAVNVAFHALSAVLVWRLGLRLGLRGAWFIGALFALHPVHVESVAWVTERKNVMSGAFYLLAALAYLRFLDAQEPGQALESVSPASSSSRRRWLWYGTSLALFVLALLAKTVTCSLPAALILMMLWQRRRITAGRILPLVPMFVIGLGMALLTAHLERVQVGADGSEFAFSCAERLQIAGRALLFYPQKLLIPWPLIFTYPRWKLDATNLLGYVPLAVVLLAAAVALVGYRRGTRGPALALAFFAGTLLPALGFFNVYPMRYSFVADHFQYLASLGFFALLCAASTAAISNRTLTGIAGAAVLIGCGVLTWRQCSVYADQETLWRATLQHNPRAWMAHSNLARLLSERGENEEALAHLQQALPLAPSTRAADQMRLSLALTLGKLGRDAQALEQYEELQRSTGAMEVHLAQTLERLGRDEEAEAFYRRALDGAGDPAALVPFGLHLLRRGRPEEALVWLERFASAHPEDTDALMFLADAYAGAGRLGDAIQTAERALEQCSARADGRTSDLIRKRLAQYRSSGS